MRSRRATWMCVWDLAILSFSMLFVAGCRPEPGAEQLPPPPEPRPSADRPPLPGASPVAFLEHCLRHYDDLHVQGYCLTMERREKVDGTLCGPEVIHVDFREHPFSVFMHWLQGAGRADKALYVEGENGGKMLVHLTGFVSYFKKVMAIDPDSPAAKQGGRFGIKQFGFRKTMEQTLRDWQDVRQAGTLDVDYLGVQQFAPVGNRPCYVLQRHAKPEENLGIVEGTFYFDRETLFQVGTILKGPRGELLAEYLYRDIQLEPEFPPDQFTPAALRR